ncbi:MAG: ABC transporter permease [Dehalococcoidia bacterium]|nr:ABC transporter permease [Dehalococcoidia bacterium]
MQKFFVLLQKELVESWKTYKIILIFAFFIALGFIVPFIAESEFQGDIFINPLRSRNILYGYTNWLSMGMIVLVPFMLMSTVAKEVKDGLAAAILVKPVGRGAYILTKFLVSYVMFALAIIIGFTICHLYALNVAKLYESDPVTTEIFFTMLGFILLYLALAIAFSIFVSTIFRNNVLAGAITMILLIASYGFSFADPFRVLVPFELIRWGQELLNPSVFQLEPMPGLPNPVTNPYWLAFGVTIGSCILSLLGSILVIRRKEI